MRAIFMVPNSDPPTLPDPSKWSADFNDFLKVCLVKNPEKRPTATQLLKSHPFILKAKSKAIIAQLVDECMQEIDEYRAQEAVEAAQAQGQAAENGTMQASSPSTSTMQSSNTGTMVHNDSISRSSNYDQGTMVFNQGTMQSQDFEEGAGDSGTMVLHSATLAKPPPPAALDPANGGRGKYEEPSYMRHMREASNKFKNAPAATATGTMLVAASAPTPAAAPAAVTVAPPPVTPADFRDIYRTARKFEASQLDSLTREDLKATIAALDKAHSVEKHQMEAAYEETKKMLKRTLEKKDKK
jgi:serine/threonine protein kinase